MRLTRITRWLTTVVMATVMLPLAGATALMDPTRPYATGRSDRQSGSWVLNSTLVSPHRRLAVINGVHVAEGESIGSATVLRIRKLDVLLQAPNKRIRLKLLPGNVRKQP